MKHLVDILRWYKSARGRIKDKIIDQIYDIGTDSVTDDCITEQLIGFKDDIL